MSLSNPNSDWEIPLPALYDKLDAMHKRIVREKYIKEQDGKCFFCHNSLEEEPPKTITDKPINWELFPPEFLRYPIHLQHDHKTGLTEGAVHAFCNAYMWNYYRR